MGFIIFAVGVIGNVPLYHIPISGMATLQENILPWVIFLLLCVFWLFTLPIMAYVFWRNVFTNAPLQGQQAYSLVTLGLLIGGGFLWFGGSHLGSLKKFETAKQPETPSHKKRWLPCGYLTS